MAYLYSKGNRNFHAMVSAKCESEGALRAVKFAASGRCRAHLLKGKKVGHLGGDRRHVALIRCGAFDVVDDDDIYHALCWDEDQSKLVFDGC